MPPVHLERPADLQNALCDLVESLNFSPQLIVFCHRQADPDALCAGAAIAAIISKLVSSKATSTTLLSPVIVAPQGSSQLGLRVSSKLGITFQDRVDLRNLDSSGLIIAVDIGDPALLQPNLEAVEGSRAKKMLIDHHHGPKDKTLLDSLWSTFDVLLVNSSACSTCELISNGVSAELIDERTAQQLLTGIMFDSQHLGLATMSTLEAVLKLVKSGASISSSKEILRSQPDRSEVIARIKALQRMEMVELGKYHLLKTQVSSFQASVARVLLETGADLAIAFGDHEGEARLSARSTHQFVEETHVDLGVLFGETARKHSDWNLVGGGHSMAASISGKTGANELADLIIAEVKQALPK
jgi:nanoRNase/pAp phosphatase (c-di-AMP/oligoRNAs hydrolase)